ncbi:cupin domain-containing protein [Sinorhizobium sp. BG8]|uniref:cupin domain-containing protein n=1 Tax=Sinorhizobium sp. BG8 TaxID=2613773 RepID=UPI00193D351B|nr:cupin domain-containing protein [Sinorhizobium sp. BG8]QRM54987.1 cupin domain-containing protein [Sinorhizobium sp. BG8]
MNLSQRFNIDNIVPEIGHPVAERLISGDPQFTSWNIEEADGGIYSGIWQSTPGKWRVEYDEWEYFHILEGHSILVSDDGEVFDLKAGERLIIRPGFKGTWEVVETTRKDYVIRL